VFINIVVLGLIFINREAVGQVIITWYQDQVQSVEQLQGIVSSFIYGGILVHIILSLLGLWYATKIRQGKRWARRSTVVMLVVSGLISFYMFTHLLAGGTEFFVHIISDVVKVAIIYVLCFPADSREFFKTAS
jgi:hypothetical protein